MITIETQLSDKQFQEVRRWLHEEYPVLQECQMIRSAGRLCIVGVRGTVLPQALTTYTVEQIVSDVREYVSDEPAPALWAGPMNRRYARRMHR